MEMGMEMEKNKILVVDDDDLFRLSLAGIIKSQNEFPIDVHEAKVGEEAFEILEKNHDIKCILLDYNFEKWGGSGQINGLEIAQRIKETLPFIPIIMTSEVGDRGDIAMKAAHGLINEFLDKPFSREQLLNKIRKYLNPIFDTEYRIDAAKAQKKLTEFGFISHCESMMPVALEVLTASSNRRNLLLVGESGTGKTLLAQIIHKLSGMTDSSYHEINITAIQPQIIESELFGHVKGAFTGAVENKNGLLDMAGSGTLLIDEIGDLPLNLQVKLNYAIGEQKSYSPVGNPGIQKRNHARVIAATLYDPKYYPQRFREDFINRFAKIIRIPPFRERPSDINLFIRYLVERIRKDRAITELKLDEAAFTLLISQDWLKNGHQIKNVLYNCADKAIRFNRNNISVSDVKYELIQDYGLGASKQESIESRIFELAKEILDAHEKNSFYAEYGIKSYIEPFEKVLLTEALKRNNWNVLATARYLGENKDTLRNHIKTLKLNIIER